MADKPAISDAAVAQGLGIYAGLVDHVLNDPARWLGADTDLPPTAGFPARAVAAVRRRAFGKLTPASSRWAQRPLQKRVRWWIRRIGVSAGLAAAAPRFAGALADRVPLQAALGASAAGLAVCATAREHGILASSDWVPLLAHVLLGRSLTTTNAAPDAPAPTAAVPNAAVPTVVAVPTAAEAEQDLAAAAEDTREPPSTMAALSQGAQRSVRTLWRLARIFLDLQNLLDKRPRGSLIARTIAKLPVVGIAGGWLDERGAIGKASQRTTRLIAESSIQATR